MPERRAGPGIWSLLTLAHSRSLLQRRRILLLAVVIAAVYATIAMLVGGMLSIFWPPAHLSSFWAILLTGTPSWDYPGLLTATPYFALELPFLPTIFMVLTSAGVGLGMSVAVVLTANFLRRRSSAGRPAAVGTAAGLTPAMIALVTLGACCSTTAAATAGIGLTAQATGTNLATLLTDNWYLGVFQLGILYVALLAQEQLLTVYGALASAEPGADRLELGTPPLDRRFAAGAALRVFLLAAGVTWALALVAAWLTVNPGTASLVVWTGWLLQHVLVGLAAVVAALVPVSAYRFLVRWMSTVPGLVLRALLVIAGVSLLVGLPPPVAAAGWHGLGNEIAGLAGGSAAWGAVSPGLSIGPALLLRWAFQYALLGSFGIILGLRPRAAMRPLLWAAATAPERTPPPAQPENHTPGRLPVPSSLAALKSVDPPGAGLTPPATGQAP